MQQKKGVVRDASSGFAPDAGTLLSVDFPEELRKRVPEEKQENLLAALANDPRPRYQRDPERVYCMSFAGLEVRFRVKGEQLTVTDVSFVLTDVKGEAE